MTKGDVDIETPALSFKIPSGALARAFEASPDIAFFHVRDAIGGMMGSFRREWLNRTRVAVGGPGGRGLRAGRLTEKPATGSGFARERTFFFRVEPKQIRKPRKGGGATFAQQARGDQGLEAISGEVFTESDVALGQEKGGTFRPRRARFLAIPTGVTLRADGRPKPRWRTPALFRRGKRPKDLVAIPTKGSGAAGPLMLFWRKRVRGGSVMLPAFLLVKQATLQPRLNFMSTWEALRSDRERRIRRALERITDGMSKA